MLKPFTSTFPKVQYIYITSTFTANNISNKFILIDNIFILLRKKVYHILFPIKLLGIRWFKCLFFVNFVLIVDFLKSLLSR